MFSVHTKPDLAEVEKEAVEGHILPNEAPRRPVEEFMQEAINSTPSYSAPQFSIEDTSKSSTS